MLVNRSDGPSGRAPAKAGRRLAWLADWQPLKTYQHGDLNASNVLVDVSLWLIDFAKAGMQPFVDCVKMISVLLFEHFPSPYHSQS